MIHIELEQSQAHIKELEQLAQQAKRSLDNQVDYSVTMAKCLCTCIMSLLLMVCI